VVQPTRSSISRLNPLSARARFRVVPPRHTFHLLSSDHFVFSLWRTSPAITCHKPTTSPPLHLPPTYIRERHFPVHKLLSRSLLSGGLSGCAKFPASANAAPKAHLARPRHARSHIASANALYRSSRFLYLAESRHRFDGRRVITEAQPPLTFRAIGPRQPRSWGPTIARNTLVISARGPGRSAVFFGAARSSLQQFSCSARRRCGMTTPPRSIRLEPNDNSQIHRPDVDVPAAATIEGYRFGGAGRKLVGGYSIWSKPGRLRDASYRGRGRCW